MSPSIGLGASQSAGTFWSINASPSAGAGVSRFAAVSLAASASACPSAGDTSALLISSYILQLSFFVFMSVFTIACFLLFSSAIAIKT